MKKITATILGLVMLLTFSVGETFAASKMEGIIDNLVGIKYKYGGTTTSGFDCSGFTQFVFNKMDIKLTRSSSSQAVEGTKVAKKDLIAGDLVFFDTAGRGTITHVGIYLGEGTFAHASTSRGVITDKLESNYYKNRFVTARRVMDDSEYSAFASAK